MRKLLLTLCLAVTLFCGCSIIPVRAPETKVPIADVIKDKAEESNLGRLVLLGNNGYIQTCLIFSTFIGTILTFSGLKKIGISVIAASILCITLLYALSLYAKFVALAGLILLIAAIFILFKNLYDRTQFEKESVASVEVAKVLLDEDGKDSLRETLGKIQSSFSQKIVKKIKERK
jgi:hypothetical protein